MKQNEKYYYFIKKGWYGCENPFGVFSESRREELEKIKDVCLVQEVPYSESYVLLDRFFDTGMSSGVEESWIYTDGDQVSKHLEKEERCSCDGVSDSYCCENCDISFYTAELLPNKEYSRGDLNYTFRQ